MPIVLRLSCLAAVFCSPLALWAEDPPCKSEKFPVNSEKKGVDRVGDNSTDRDEILKSLILTCAEVRKLREDKAEDQLEIDSLFRRIHELEKKVSAQQRELKILKSDRSDRKQAASEAPESLITPIGCLVAPANTPGEEDILHFNKRSFQIPIRILPQRQGELRELHLYLSKDQGRTWELYARSSPTQKGFDFHAAQDGLLYFSLGLIDAKGRQDPADISRTPVGQKILIDTVKPAVQIVSAKWVGDEIQVRWKIREQNPLWSTLKLEYQVGASPTESWTPVALCPAEQGNLRFSPEAAGPVTLHLTMSDMAGNKGGDWRVVTEPKHHDRATSSRYKW